MASEQAQAKRQQHTTGLKTSAKFRSVACFAAVARSNSLAPPRLLLTELALLAPLLGLSRTATSRCERRSSKPTLKRVLKSERSFLDYCMAWACLILLAAFGLSHRGVLLAEAQFRLRITRIAFALACSQRQERD